MEGSRREAIICTLREEYGITTVEELMEAIRTMKKLDITQFVYPVKAEGGAAANTGRRSNRGPSRQSPE